MSERLAQLYIELTAKGGNVDAVIDATLARMKTNDRLMSELAVKGPQLYAVKVAEQAKRDAANFQIMAAAHGNFGASLVRLNEKMEKFTRTAAVGFGVATASITGLVAAASPDTFSTLTGSIQLLSSSIGQIFIPAVVKLSGFLQNAANWIHGLDASTKGNIASFVLWGVAGLGAVMIGGRLIGVVTAVTLGYKATTLAAGQAAIANVGLAGSFNTVAMAAGRATAMIGGLQTAAKFVAPLLVAMKIQEGIEGAQEGFEKKGVFGQGGAIDNVNSAINPTKKLLDWLLPKIFSKGKQTDSNILTNINFQSQFMGIEDQWRRLQTAGASQSPLEQQLQQQHLESRELLQQIANNTARQPVQPLQPGSLV